MVKMFYNCADMDIPQLVNLYADSLQNQKKAEDFASYIQWDFFRQPDACCCVLLKDGRYVSALRLERFEDGFLLSGLQTAPHHRNKGYGSRLLQDVLASLCQQDRLPVYSHIHKKNKISLRLHCTAGFCIISDYAKLLDGTVSAMYVTLRYE